jgi:hypothetical protein
MSTITTARGVTAGLPTNSGSFKATEHADSGISLGAPSERAYADASHVFTDKYETAREKVDAYKAELDQAVADLATDENWLAYLQANAKFHRYSFTNQMLISLQSGGKATRVASFKKWKDDFERTVNKGEKALGIFAPMLAKAKDANGNDILDGNGRPTQRCIGFKVVPVFDVAQTDGKPLPTIEQELSETPPDGFVEDMVAAAEKAGYSVEFRNMDSHASGTAQGWSDPQNKQIVIDADLSEGSQAATLSHELGHVYAGHCEPDAMGKYHTGVGGCRGRYEVEAESVAYSLTRSQGMSMSQAKLSAQYVAGWSRHDKNALRESAETVSKATKKILDSTTFRNLVD